MNVGNIAYLKLDYKTERMVVNDDIRRSGRLCASGLTPVHRTNELYAALPWASKPCLSVWARTIAASDPFGARRRMSGQSGLSLVPAVRSLAPAPPCAWMDDDEASPPKQPSPGCEDLGDTEDYFRHVHGRRLNALNPRYMLPADDDELRVSAL